MTIRLADYSDAELGALVRRSLTQETLDAMLHERPKALATIRRHQHEAATRTATEREERKAMQTWPAMYVLDTWIPALFLFEEQWHEEAPAQVQDCYRAALRELGMPREPEEVLTWMDLKIIHVGLLANFALHEGEGKKATALAYVLNLPLAEAVRRIIALRKD